MKIHTTCAIATLMISVAGLVHAAPVSQTAPLSQTTILSQTMTSTGMQPAFADDTLGNPAPVWPTQESVPSHLLDATSSPLAALTFPAIENPWQQPNTTAAAAPAASSPNGTTPPTAGHTAATKPQKPRHVAAKTPGVHSVAAKPTPARAIVRTASAATASATTAKAATVSAITAKATTASAITYAQIAEAVESDTGAAASVVEKTLNVGQSDVYDFSGIETTAVGDPAIADIMPISKNRLLVNAKSAGQTTIFVFDRLGKHVIDITVPAQVVNLAPIVDKIRRDLNSPSITVHAVNDTVFLEGTATSAAEAQQAEAVADTYGAKVRNLIVVNGAAPGKSLADTYADLLNSNFGAYGIKALVVDDHTIVLSGKYATSVAAPVVNTASTSSTAPNTYTATNAADLAGVAKQDPLERYLSSLPPELKVVNLISFETKPQRQILVHAKVIDIDRTSAKNLGVNWGTVGYSVSSTGALTPTFNNQPILFGQAANLSSSISNNNGGFYSSVFGGGLLTRVFPLAAQISALVTDNKARVLSEPSLLVLDGNTGSMLVGGEIPIPVAQSAAGGGTSISVQYKQYGIQLDVAPTIVSDGKIQLTVTPEVSALDFADGVQETGFTIPALTVRRATSTLKMDDGETLVIGGLYNNNDSKQIQKIPILGDIPVIGEFFRNTVTNKSESELLILIEPEIVKPTTTGVIPPPADTIENLPIDKPLVKRDDFKEVLPGVGAGPAANPQPPVVNLPAAGAGSGN